MGLVDIADGEVAVQRLGQGQGRGAAVAGFQFQVQALVEADLQAQLGVAVPAGQGVRRLSQDSTRRAAPSRASTLSSSQSRLRTPPWAGASLSAG